MLPIYSSLSYAQLTAIPIPRLSLATHSEGGGGVVHAYLLSSTNFIASRSAVTILTSAVHSTLHGNYSAYCTLLCTYTARSYYVTSWLLYISIKRMLHLLCICQVVYSDAHPTSLHLLRQAAAIITQAHIIAHI